MIRLHFFVFCLFLNQGNFGVVESKESQFDLLGLKSGEGLEESERKEAKDSPDLSDKNRSNTLLSREGSEVQFLVFESRSEVEKKMNNSDSIYSFRRDVFEGSWLI